MWKRGHNAQPEDPGQEIAMSYIVLIIYLASFATGAMALALAILYSATVKTKWSKYIVPLQAVLVGVMVLGLLMQYARLFSGNMTLVLVVRGILTGVLAYFIVVFPWAISQLVSQPLKRWALIPLVLVSALYVALTVLDMIFKVASLQLGISILVGCLYFSCIALIWSNLKRIEDKLTRSFLLVFNIVSLSMIPVSILAIIFPEFEFSSYSLYYLAFSIIMVTYFFNYFSSVSKEHENSIAITFDKASSFKISEREFEVVKLVEEGQTNKEIAQALGISVNTVNNHLANIFQKTGVRSRIDLLNKMRGL